MISTRSGSIQLFEYDNPTPFGKEALKGWMSLYMSSMNETPTMSDYSIDSTDAVIAEGWNTAFGRMVYGAIYPLDKNTYGSAQKSVGFLSLLDRKTNFEILDSLHVEYTDSPQTTQTSKSNANDVAWLNVVAQDSKVITSDLQLVSFVAENNDLSGLKTYSDQMADDMQIALETSQKYMVSSGLQESKYYWEQALITMKAGAEKSSLGCVLLDGNLITQATALISKGNEYVMLANRALNLVSAPAYVAGGMQNKPYVGPTSAYAGTGQGAKLGMKGANLLDINFGDKPTTTAYQPISNQVQSGRYPANKDTKVYHEAGCTWAGKIEPENLVWFSSPNEAEAAGYRHCEKC